MILEIPGATPLVSVIIPAYNAEKNLSKCLESVLAQNYEPFEIIVVDNNSIDKTKEIILEFKKSNKKVKYVFEEIRGRAIARNAGIKNTTGEIIAMLDSDCFVPINWIQEISSPIIKGEESVTMGPYRPYSNNFWSGNAQKADDDFFKNSLNGNFINHLDTKNFAIKANLMRKVMFDVNLGGVEDLEFFLRIKRFSKVRFVPSIEVIHNHEDNLKAIVKTSFDRGFWLSKVYRKHKQDKNDVLSFKSLSIANLLKFPFWAVYMFLTNNTGYAYFRVVKDLAWRIGIATEKIDHFFNERP